MAKKPNILFFHVDNLGMGELGCYEQAASARRRYQTHG